ncbi:VCBS repeat-containing protein [Mycolicibacterium fluoranthenivorans]|uniref:VCBS repeat-containing protein n=1 Tax=Mycolicibacterium fluoranthenivorans TaxID=258505 RepID=A0A1G4WNX5_9MYCO|nr:VCBS repeat-containing protein [Mycolicibacterium fluoranthenivorans]
MGAGRFVGRVGGLAVALGVGAAVSLGAGIAWAEEGSGSGTESGGATSVGDTSGGGSPSGTPAPSTSTGTPSPAGGSGAEPGTHADGDDEGVSPGASSEHEVKPTGGSGSSRKRKSPSSSASKRETRETSGAPKSSVTSRPARHEENDEAPRAVTAAPVAVATSVTAATVPAAEVRPAAPVVTQARGVASGAVAESSLLGGVPSSPLVNSPLLWVAAAASRREFGGGSGDSGEGASLAAAATANAAGAGAVPNSAPTATVTVGKPNTTSGVVTGTVKGSDVDKDPLTYSAPASTTKGSVVINATTGKFTYTPTVQARAAAASNDAADKQDSFVVTVTDVHGASGTVIVPVAIDPNSVPTAAAPTVNAPNPTTGVVTGTVKGADADKDKLTYSTPAVTAKGKVTINATTGAFTYTPTQAAREAAAGSDIADTQDSFTVTIKDAQGASTTAMVTVDISPNKAPAGVTVSLGGANSATGAILGAVNATDPEGGPVKYTVGATATKSKVTIDANSGALTYTPTAAARHAAGLTVGAVTEDSFTVSIADTKGAVTTQLVTVTILPFNTAPTANPAPGKPNTTTGVVTGSINGADADKDKLTYSVATSTTKGDLTLDSATGRFTYTPAQAARLAAGAAPAIDDPARSDSFTVTISDAYGGTITKTVNLVVDPNNAPTGAISTVGTPNPTTGVVTGTVKATDPDKDKLTYTTVATTDKGKITLNASTGAFSYTPTQAAREAAAGTDAAATQDSFTVTIKDAQGASITTTVTVNISPNKAPINAVVGNVSTNPGTGVVTGTVNAIDPDGVALPKYSVPATTPRGKVTINAATGLFTYTPTAASRHAAGLTVGAITGDSFTVSITDEKGAVTTKVVNVTIVAANAVPTATVSVNKPNATTGVVTGTVKGADADKDTLTYSGPSSTTKGAVTLNSTTGAFVYTPSATARDAAAGGVTADKIDTFTVTITDGHTGGVITKAVQVTISPKTVVGVVGSVDVPGENYEAVMNGAGTRAVITTVTGDDTKGYSTSVTVINVATGTKIGSTVKLTGQSDGVVFTDDGTRALVATSVTATDTASTRLVVINAGTGKQVGSTLTLDGNTYLPDALQFNSDGSRAILTIDGYDADTGAAVTRLTLVNTATGARVGVTREYANDESEDDFRFVDPVTIDLNPGGSRLIVTTSSTDPNSNVESTQVTIINTADGAQVGTTTTVTGAVYNPVSYSADYSRAILAYTTIVDAENSTTHVIVLNVATGVQIGDTVSYPGAGAAHLSDDGSLFVVNTMIYTDGVGTYTSIAVFNTAAGTQIGTPVTVGGVTVLPARFNAAGTRAVVAVYTLNPGVPGGLSAVRVVVVDTATGAQVGTTVDIAGTTLGYAANDPRTLQPFQFNTAGTRALVTTAGGDVTNVAVINTLTGAQVGTTLTMPGAATFPAQDGTSFLPPLYNDDESRAFVTSVSGDETTGYLTHVTLLNTATGAEVGSTITLVGAPGVYADDTNILSSGNRAVYLTYTGDDTSGYTTRVAIIDTDNGTQLGATGTFVGSWSSYVQFNAAGNRITVITDTQSTDTDPATTELTVYDAATGAQVGSTLTFTGDTWTGATVDDDPSRVIVYTASATSSTVTAVDLLTATRMGSTLTLPGEAWSTYRSDDSSRVVVASLTGNGTTTKVATLQIGDATGAPFNGSVTVDDV